MKLKVMFLCFCLVITATISTLQAGDAVWWEGESAVKSDFISTDLLAKPLKANRLSQQKWISCSVKSDDSAKKNSYSATYEINVPATSEYTFWARELYRRSASPWKFRFDDGEWVEVKRDHKFTNRVELGKDLSVVWCQYNKVKLSQGKHKFEIEILPREKDGAFYSAFDCFFLTDVPFKPQSLKKPAVLAQYGFIGTYIWLEGEDAKSDFLNTIPGIVKSSKQLSNEQWLICSAPSADASKGGFTAKWEFNVAIGDRYYLWMREGIKSLKSQFNYRVDNSKNWKTAFPGAPSFDNVQIDNSTSVGWVSYGRYYLDEGRHTFEISLKNPNKLDEFKLAIDAICLSIEPFSPSGKLKPDVKIIPPNGWRVFRPIAKGNKNSKNVLSLRYLNEKKSGSHGFAKVDAKGIVFQDGTRERFWGVNAYVPMMMDKISVNNFVSRMADYGVNLIRINGPLGVHFGSINNAIMDKLFYFIKACKSHGIYVALALYSPEDYLLNARSGFEGFKKAAHPYGMLYLDTKFRDKYKKWATFLTKVNPYTKLKLCKDPTILWFEIERGDGIFSDAFHSIPEQQMMKLEKVYNRWLITKHGGIQEALHAWSMQNRYHPVIESDGLRSAHPSYKLLPPETFSQAIIHGRSTDYLNKRKMDQLKFLIQHYQTVNRELLQFLRGKCEFKGLISLGNSSTAVPEILDPVVNYIHASGDVMARKGSFDPKVLDDVELFSNNTFFQNRSALKNPLGSPLAAPIFRGKANVATDLNWALPNQYRAEAVPFVAAYSALQGSNTYLWYNIASPSWSSRLTKYTLQDPAIIGAFPGYALMFRRGDIAPAKTLVDYKLSLADIAAMKGNNCSVEQFKGQLALGEVNVEEKGAINPLACFAGKVELSLDKAESGIQKSLDSQKFINASEKTVKASTGNLKLNYGNGQLLINTPRAQGVTGFFKKDLPLALHDVEITFNSGYGTVLVISLDSKKLGESDHILLQFFAEESNYHWKTSAVPGKIKGLLRLENIGDAPLIVKNVSGIVAFPGIAPKGWEIWKLDMNGRRLGQIHSQGDSILKVALPDSVFYIELIRK